MKRYYRLLTLASVIVTVIAASASAWGQPATNPSSDPLINQRGEEAIYLGAFLLIITVSATVGLVSRRVEHAIFAALALSLSLVAIFFFTRS